MPDEAQLKGMEKLAALSQEMGLYDPPYGPMAKQRNREIEELTQELKTLQEQKELTFSQLRHANLMRLPTYRNKNGQFTHTKPDGSDWPISEWIGALGGEYGELCGWKKKLARQEITEEEFKREAAKELADIVTYADILAVQLGVDLGKIVRDKFNEVSERVGSSVKL